MDIFKNDTRKVVVALGFVAVVFLCAGYYMEMERSDYSLQTKVKIAEQEQKLAIISDLTHRDGADEVVSEIIQDCSSEDRVLFDELLGKLAQLRGGELVQMRQLFNACGNFFAERKAVMVARLEREFEVYADLVEIVSLVDKKADGITYDVASWERLVALEKERSLLSTKLVVLQGDIIQALITGESVASESMQTKLVEGQQTKERLIALSEQIEALLRELRAV